MKKINVEEFRTLSSNLNEQYVEILKARDNLSSLLLALNSAKLLLKSYMDEREECFYKAFLDAQCEVLLNVLLLENEIQDLGNEIESSSIYAELVTGKDYPEALYAIKQKISPETADDEPPMFYEFDYESYGDPADYVLGYDTESFIEPAIIKLPEFDLKPFSERTMSIFNDTLCPDDKIVDVWDDDVIL